MDPKHHKSHITVAKVAQILHISNQSLHVH